MAQYAPQYGQAVIIQPGQMTSAPFYDNVQPWNAGLCDCCNNMGDCCYAHCCWPCFLCSLAKSLNESTMGACCFANAMLPAYRMKVRTTFKIQGDACNDMCTTMWCPFCVGVQLRNELTSRNIS